MTDLTIKILDKLPSNWTEVTLRDYIKLSGIKVVETDDVDGMSVGIGNTLEVISVLSETSVERLEELPMQDILVLGKKVDFISIEPTITKSGDATFKSLEEITYNDFVTTNEILSKEPFKNMHKIIKCFSKKKITEDEALDLTMPEVMNGFFLQRQGLKKSYHDMIQSLRKEIIKLLKNPKMIL